MDKEIKQARKIKDNLNTYTIETLTNAINSIITTCPICGEKIHLYEDKCKNSAIINDDSIQHWYDKSKEECNKKELKHIFFREKQIIRDEFSKKNHSYWSI